jgi:hypothetical protein
MKKTIIFAWVLCAMPIVFSCGPNKAELAEKARQDSIRVADSIKQVEEKAAAEAEAMRVNDSIAHDSAVIAFITDMYNTTKYEDYKFLKQHCSDKLMRKLRADYDYEGDGLAVWDFRSGAQDGPSDVHKVTAVTPEGGGWYKYDFIDMGVKGFHKLRISGTPDNFIMEDLK